MELEYYKVVKRDNQNVTDCKYNEGCRCADKHCWKCGWNPKVAQRRKEALLKKLGVTV